MLHAENDRHEKEKQKISKEDSTVSKITSLSSSVSPTISSKLFYGNTETGNLDSCNNNNNNNTKNTIIYSNLENKIKSSYKNKLLQNIRTNTIPYQNQKPCNALNNNPQKLSNQITCSLSIETLNRFIVIPSGFHGKLIDIFKTIPSRSYNSTTKIWAFNINDYELVRSKINLLHPEVLVGSIPKCVLKLLEVKSTEYNSSILNSIESTLINTLLPFQKDGVCFGISKQGRCLIADEMGLGKTYQALALADFYRNDWPLLICTTAIVRETWFKKIRELLPYVSYQHVMCMTSAQEYIGDAKILILTYTLMEKNFQRLLEKKFGCIIFDESQLLKNFKAKCTNAAQELALHTKRVILLSGTPALSRPCELFSQLQMIDPHFLTFKEYSTRYCDGKQTNFGWNASGKSNLTELNIILNRKFMIRRTKQDVFQQLCAKQRETIILDQSLIWQNDDTSENMKCYADDYLKYNGKEREEILLQFYNETGIAKSNAVCEYIKGILNNTDKFIVFAHHRFMLNKISKTLSKLHIDYMRIDGSTRHTDREKYINRFQNDVDCRVAVLSLKACNTGISLTSAQLILFAELDWNPSTLAQAESRAHRIGQLGTVICRYLIANGTADDIIWPLLQKKQDTLIEAGLFDDDSGHCTHAVIKHTSHNKNQNDNDQFVNLNESTSKMMETSTNCDDHMNLLDGDEDLFLNIE